MKLFQFRLACIVKYVYQKDFFVGNTREQQFLCHHCNIGSGKESESLYTNLERMLLLWISSYISTVIYNLHMNLGLDYCIH